MPIDAVRPAAEQDVVELGPADPVAIAAVPDAPEVERSWLTSVLPALSVLGMVGFAIFAASPLLIAMSAGLALVSVVVALVTVRVQRRRADRAWAERRTRYLDHLADVEATLSEAAHRQRAHDQAAGPSAEPAAWVVTVGHGRVAARRRAQPASTAADHVGAADLSAAAAAITDRHAAVDGLAVRLPLRAGDRLMLVGALRPLLRSLLLELAAKHTVEELLIGGDVPPAEEQWLSCLPHWHGTDSPSSEVSGRRHVVVSDTGGAAVDPRVATDAVLVVLQPGDSVLPRATAVIRAAPLGVPGVVLIHPSPEPFTTLIARPAVVSHADALTAARRYGGRARVDPAPALTLEDLLAGVPPGRLGLPLGTADGSPVILDLAEAAQGGDGPHGLIIGSTGSGKSELLRTLVLAAATACSPDALSILLIDYKGGAGFGDLSALPHVAGLATNLSDDPLAADRLSAALRAESRRRQRILREAGASDLASYDAHRGANTSLPPLPRLLIVIDEYAELVEQAPDVLEALTSLGRIGRSLGVHLVLSSQRLDDGKLRGLDTHLRYRICLRTLNPGDSSAMLGSLAALQLPAQPGWAWLNRDGELVRWRAVRATDADLVRACRRPSGTVAAPLLLPGLPEQLCLDAVGSQLTKEGTPVGRLDVPEHAMQPPLRFALDSPLAVAGRPGSGRSTALATATLALADAYAPRDLAVHVITAAASPLAAIGGVPHIGTVAIEPELAAIVVGAVADEVRRRRSGGCGRRMLLVVDDVGALVREQEQLLPSLLAIATGGSACGVHLVVSATRWSELRGGLREACVTRWELPLADIADSDHPQLTRRAGSRPPGRVLTGDGHWAQLALPGRCGCMSSLRGETDTKATHPAAACSRATSTSDLIARIARRGGPPTTPMQPLPSLVPAERLPHHPPESPAPAGAIWLGVAGAYAQPLALPLGAGDHLIVLGNASSGRSGLLRALRAQLPHRPIWTIDPRRSLGRATAESPGAYAVTGDQICAVLGGLARSFSNGRRAGDADAGPVLLIDDLDLAVQRETSAAFTAFADELARAANSGLSVIVARRVSGSARAAFEPFYGRLVELCESAVVLSGDPAEGPVVGGLRPQPLPPGRGRLVRRGELVGDVQATYLGPVSGSRPTPGGQIVTSAPSSDLACSDSLDSKDPGGSP